MTDVPLITGRGLLSASLPRSSSSVLVAAPDDPRPATEIVPGLWRLPLPLSDNPLRHVNTYLAAGPSGYLLIDCGWDTADSLRGLEDHLRTLGLRFGDIHQIVVTHVHPDHYGAAGRLREITNAKLVFHRQEQVAVESRYSEAEQLLGEMREWLRLNGTPETLLDSLTRASTGILERVQVAYPDELLDGGEEIIWGHFTFRIIWTPGHAAGHVCLYEPLQHLLLSGDHVLPRITPSVGLHTRSIGNPLADFLDALGSVRNLDVSLVLPGHGEPFTDLRGRVDEILHHHDQRLGEMCGLLGSGRRAGLTGFKLAQLMRWSRGRTWTELPGFEQRLALTEVLAHLELLHARGRVAKQFCDGAVSYGACTDPAAATPTGRATA